MEYLNDHFKGFKLQISSVLSSLLFSLFLLVGFLEENSLKGWKLAIVLVIFFVLSTLLISCFFHWFDEKKLSVQTGSRHSYFSSHTFLKSFLILVLAYIPYGVASYPAIFLYDECSQLLQGFPELGILLPDYLYDNVIKEGVLYNEHFPVVHTLLLNLVFKAGLSLFHSANVAIFLYTCLQMLFMFAAISYCLKTLVRELHMRDSVVIVILLFFILSPRIQNYMMVTTKDVLYAGCLLFFLTNLFQLFRNASGKYYCGFALSALGLYFTRNEAKYILAVFFLISLFLLGKQWARQIIVALSATVLLTIILSQVVFPSVGVIPGSKREMLSVPFQQTALYLHEHPTEVTPEEKEAISAVLDYGWISSHYDPNRSDTVKDTFREKATSNELSNYFSVWFQMLKKHPSTYLKAFANNYYQYVSPSKYKMNPRPYDYSQSRFEWLSEKMEPLSLSFSYPEKLSGFRNTYERIREKIAHIPVLDLLISCWFYTWPLILLLIYSMRNRSKKSFAFLLYPFGVFLMCFLGPCNGFFCRYLYPLMFVLPMLIIGSLALNKDSGGNQIHG